MIRKKTTKSDLTIKEIEEIKGSVKSFVLPKGTLLYRTQSIEFGCEIKLLEDEDTGKIGIYFANSSHIPIGMVLEYKKDLNLLVYKTNKDIKVYVGKYAFRELEPERFFKNFKKWQKGRYNTASPKNKKYWNHYDSEAYPIHYLFSGGNCEVWSKINIAEIFITDTDDIDFVKLDKLITMHYAKKFLINELNRINSL